MRCPKCQSDVPEGHSYCSKCRISVRDHVLDNPRPSQSGIDRAGKRVLDLLILLVLLGGGVLLARSIHWKELLNGVKPTGRVSQSAQQEREAQPGSPAKRGGARSSRTSKEKPASPAKPATSDSEEEKAKEIPPAKEEQPRPNPETIAQSSPQKVVTKAEQ